MCKREREERRRGGREERRVCKRLRGRKEHIRFSSRRKIFNYFHLLGTRCLGTQCSGTAFTSDSSKTTPNSSVWCSMQQNMISKIYVTKTIFEKFLHSKSIFLYGCFDCIQCDVITERLIFLFIFYTCKQKKFASEASS